MSISCSEQQHPTRDGDIFQIMPSLLSQQHDYLPLALVVILTILSVVVIMAGVVGNLAIIFLVAKRKKLQTWSNGLLLHLTICDLFTEIFLLPTLIWIILSMKQGTSDSASTGNSVDVKMNNSDLNDDNDTFNSLPRSPRIYVVHIHYSLQIILLTMITVSGTLIAIGRLLLFYRVPPLTYSQPIKIAIPTCILILSWAVSAITVIYPIVNVNSLGQPTLRENSTLTIRYITPMADVVNSTDLKNVSDIFKITPYDTVLCSSVTPSLDETQQSYYGNLALRIAPQVLLGSVISASCYCLIVCKVRRKRNKVLSKITPSGVVISPYLALNRPSYLVVGNGTEFLTLSLNEFRRNKRNKYIETRAEQRIKEQESIAPTHKKKALKLIGAGVSSTGSMAGNNNNNHRSKRKEYKTEMSSFMIILISTISYAPITGWCLAMSHEAQPVTGEHLPSLAVLWLLVSMGSAIHPYMYTLKCEDFRKEIKRYINNTRFTGFPFEGNVILTGRNGANTAPSQGPPSMGDSRGAAD